MPLEMINTLHEPLLERGFQPEGRAWRRGPLVFSAEGQWLTVRDDEPAGPPDRLGLGAPGLWKWRENGAPLHRMCEVPAWVVSDPDETFEDAEAASFGKLVDWALETHSGRVPGGWAPPDRGRVETWMPRGALTLQTRGVARQGELVLGPDRWAVRMPVVPRLADGLGANRRRALEDLLFEAQCRWAMVRLGLSGGGAFAEVDLTGGPHSEELFSAGLDVLRHVTAWLVETADVLADPGIGIQWLDGGVNNAMQNERKTP